MDNPPGELAAVVAESLREVGSDTLFGIPGGGNNLELIGAAEAAGIRFVLTHTEAAAAYMAGVYAELRGVVTGCVATRGPGAANAVNGVAQAWLDRQPVIMLTDAVSSADAPRIAHQRLDQHALFGGMTKASGALGGPDAAEVMNRAVTLASAPRPGPVHLDFDPTATPGSSFGPRQPWTGGDITRARELLTRGRRPVVLVGMGARDQASAVRELLRDTSIPVLQTYKAKGVVPDSWPNAAGLLTGATIESPVLEAADVVLAVGLDTVELIPGAWPYSAPVVSVGPWLEDSPYFPVAEQVVGPLGELLPRLLGALADDWEPEFAGRERARCAARLCGGPPPRDGLAPWDVVARARSLAPPGSVATVDSGAHMLAAMPLWDTEDAGEVLISSGLATMGFALPAAVAAALAKPDVRTLCFVGDGGLGMVSAELETIARLSLPITVIVFNDSALSLIAVKQKPHGNGGKNAISYVPTNYASVAAGYGVESFSVGTVSEFERAMSKSLTVPGPALLDVRVDPGGYPHVLEVIRGARKR